MNGSNGIVPTVDLATNNTYPYPMYGYGNNGGFFGSEGIWALVLLAMLFGNGWGGFGGFGGGYGAGFGLADGGLLGYAIGNNATKGDLSDGLFSIQNGNKLDNLSTQISDGFTNVATNLCNVRSDILTGNMGIQNSILDAKYAAAMGDASTQRDILLQTTQLENQLSTVALSNQAHMDNCCCDLKSLIREDGEKTRALITSNTIQDLRDQLSAAKDVISDQRTATEVVNAIRPFPIPAYPVSSPYVGLGYNGGFYGNGFYNNTIY